MSEVFNSVKSGEIAGSATAVQLPNIPCRLAIITAMIGNAGNVYIGGAGVTIPEGTADATAGLVLDAGMSVTLPIRNLNLLYLISDNAGDDLTYLALG